MTAHTRNITKVFRMADHKSLLDGMDWYARANVLANTLDPLNPRRAAGVIASLSPLTSWPLNIRYATAVYDGTPFSTLGNSMRAAFRIYNGEDAADVLNGPKTRAFFFTIADPSNREAVTVDRHAIDIAHGKPLPNNSKERSINKREYAEIAGMYHRAARILSREYGRDIYAHQVQAVTWIYWRRNVTRAFFGDA